MGSEVYAPPVYGSYTPVYMSPYGSGQSYGTYASGQPDGSGQAYGTGQSMGSVSRWARATR
jgi:hypothetical protein